MHPATSGSCPPPRPPWSTNSAGMMSKAIMPSSLTSRTFVDSPGKGSPRDSRSTTKTADDRRRT
eukprot:6179140-Pleurochrysis_carterae.AAC.1